MLGRQDKPIKQVKFHGRLGESYVTASPGADQGGGAPVPVPATGEGAARQAAQARPTRAAARSSSRRRQGEPDRRHGREPRRRRSSRRPRVGFPVYYPRKLVPGSSYRRGRAAHLHDTRTATTGATAPTRWSSSPATSASTTACRAPRGATRRSSSTPSEKRTIRGRKYLLFYNGDRLRLVGWKTERGAYWISNTLLQNALREGDAGRRALARPGRR